MHFQLKPWLKIKTVPGLIFFGKSRLLVAQTRSVSTIYSRSLTFFRTTVFDLGKLAYPITLPRYIAFLLLTVSCTVHRFPPSLSVFAWYLTGPPYNDDFLSILVFTSTTAGVQGNLDKSEKSGGGMGTVCALPRFASGTVVVRILARRLVERCTLYRQSWILQ